MNISALSSEENSSLPLHESLYRSFSTNPTYNRINIHIFPQTLAYPSPSHQHPHSQSRPPHPPSTINIIIPLPQTTPSSTTTPQVNVSFHKTTTHHSIKIEDQHPKTSTPKNVETPSSRSRAQTECYPTTHAYRRRHMALPHQHAETVGAIARACRLDTGGYV